MVWVSKVVHGLFRASRSHNPTGTILYCVYCDVRREYGETGIIGTV